MTATSFGRSAMSAALIVAAVTTTLVGTASPGSAGKGAKNTQYTATWTFTGDVTASLGTVSNARLVDYASGDYYDRTLAQPESPDAITVGGVQCRYGTAYQSGINLYGAETTWANMEIGTTIGARLQVACYYPNGEQHRFHWGSFRNSSGQFVKPSTNCLELTRTSDRTYEVKTPAEADCVAQDEIVDAKPSKQLSSSTRPIPFSATITLTEAPPSS